MLFKLDTKFSDIQRLPGKYLSDVSWKEKDLQNLLFENIEKVFQDEDLLLLMQSRNWQEEPDLMAIDSIGDLYIFELKAWESSSENILQALRYGQIFGQYDYHELNSVFLKHFPENKELLVSINNKFGSELKEKDINTKQHFIIITNGLDYKTREAILYWRSQGLDVKSWVYRIYVVSNEVLFEIDTFEINENPYSDIEEGYYILNTNRSNDIKDDEDMINNHKAAAYFDPWKRNIEKLKKGNVVFLYRSGEGIVAYGYANGRLEKSDYHNDPEHKNEEYFMKLDHFKKLERPMDAQTIKSITGINYRFMSTMFGIDSESGEKIINYIKDMLI
jgi:hypothetical protein